MENKKRVIIIISIILSAAIVAGTVVTGFLTNWFGLDLGPMGKLLKAAQNTLSADSVKIEFDENGYEMEFSYFKLGDKTALYSDDDGYRALIYDGKNYSISGDGDYADIYENEEFDTIFDTIDNINEGEEIDWDEIIEAFYLDDIVDDKHMDEFVELLIKEKFRDKEWLEKYLGFEKDGDKFKFDFKVDKAYKELIDLADKADILKEDKEELEETVEYMEGVTAEAEITIEDKKLSEIEVVLEVKEYDDKYKYSVKFSDYNDCGLSKGEVEDFIDEVEEAKEEYDRIHYCSDCGDWKSYGVCWDCDYYGSGYCSSCGYYSYYDIYNREGTYYCSDCIRENFGY